ncbi:hypothetical protein [Haloprofundus salilacus]|uniref:hypothetical protein n=1 Tax=Haloprofundus salilacus TaxID=2876190 RepID=UPI001CD00155|nr:hypothetical protein [Haloprofundus salilacus]
MTDSEPTRRTDRTDAPTTEAPATTETPTSDESADDTRDSRRSADLPDDSASRRRRVADSDAAFRCRHCGDPFVEERHLALHRGLNHAADLSEMEREAYRNAYEREEADLKRFRLLSLGALVVLYFGFLFVYAVVT